METITDEQQSLLDVAAAATDANGASTLDATPSAPNEESAPAAAPESAPAATETPKPLAGKFASQDELEKGFGSLVEKVGMEAAYRQLAGTQGAKPAGQSLTLEDREVGEDATIEQVLDLAGLDRDEVANQIAENGKLTDDQYARLKKTANLPRGLIDQHLGLLVEAAKASSASIRGAAIELVGSEEQLEKLREWASATLDGDDRAWFNEQVGPGTTRSASQRAMEWLVGHHAQAVGAGNARPLIDGAAPAPSSGAAGFASSREMVTALTAAKEKHGGNPTLDATYMARLRNTERSVIEGHKL